MSTTVTLNGVTYTDSDMADFGYKSPTTGSDGTTRPRWQNMWVDGLAKIAADQSSATGAATTATTQATNAATAATLAASSQTAAQALTGALVGIGTEPQEVPRNSDLGSAAYCDWRYMPGRVFVRTLSGATTLTPADGGRVIRSAGYAVTLPSPADPAPEMGPGWAVWIKATSGTVTVSPGAGVTIDGSASLNVTTAAMLVWVDATTWTAIVT